MRDHRRSWPDAFETAGAISATYMVEGVSLEVAALLWVRYMAHAAASTPDESALQDLRSAA